MKSTWIPAKKHKRLVTSRNSCLAQNMFFFFLTFTKLQPSALTSCGFWSMIGLMLRRKCCTPRSPLTVVVQPGLQPLVCYFPQVHFNVFMKTREVAINGCSLIGVWVTIAQVEEWNHFSSSVLSRLPVHSNRICSIRKPPRLPEEESGVGDWPCLCQGAWHRFHADLSAAAAVRSWRGDRNALSQRQTGRMRTLDSVYSWFIVIIESIWVSNVELSLPTTEMSDNIASLVILCSLDISLSTGIWQPGMFS